MHMVISKLIRTYLWATLVWIMFGGSVCEYFDISTRICPPEMSPTILIHRSIFLLY